MVVSDNVIRFDWAAKNIGRHQERESIARKMLEAGANPAFIKEITGLSENDIQKPSES